MTTAAPIGLRDLAIAISLGDPAGIGPEIVAAAVAAAPAELRARLVVFGDRAPLERASGARWPADVALVEAGFDATPGAPDERSGAAQVAYLEAAVAAAKRGEVSAIVTAPISKTWARRAGFDFPGHTEMLAARFGVPADGVAMMFAGPRLKVVLATVHVPLAQVARVLTRARIAAVTRMFAASLARDFAIARPRVGVVGLNPHAGEGGLLGAEDDAVIAPAIADVADLHAELGGPLVPDAAFRDAANGRWDGLVAMYHDQALIPVKLLDFEDAVNVTLGLPIVRTSPDHGTAYDIAGRGVARWSSFAAALRLADQMLERRAHGVLASPA